jgi:hypothetical protein
MTATADAISPVPRISTVASNRSAMNFRYVIFDIAHFT